MSTAKGNEFPFHVPSLFPYIPFSLQCPQAQECALNPLGPLCSHPQVEESKEGLHFANKAPNVKEEN